jgi:hypothetical protein
MQDKYDFHFSLIKEALVVSETLWFLFKSGMTDMSNVILQFVIDVLDRSPYKAKTAWDCLLLLLLLLFN